MTVTDQQSAVFEAMVRQGTVSQEQLDRAVAEQNASGRDLGEILVEQGSVTGTTLVALLARELGVPGCYLRHGLIDPAALTLIDKEEMEYLAVLPLFKVRDTLTIAMGEPLSLVKVDRLTQLTGCNIRPVFALKANILEFVKKYGECDLDIDAFLVSLEESDVQVVEREGTDEHPATNLDKMIEGSPIINLVNMSLLTGIRDRASDIHVDPDKNGTRISYRIDGVLRDLMRPPAGLHAAIVSRIKVIGKMDIAERRLPQEGRVRIVADGRGIDLRVSSMPTMLGEKIVLRILDDANLHVRLETLGFRSEILVSFVRMLSRPTGLVLVTGPTGSGKTTTLYSGLYLLRSPERNIVTVEDPVEYQLSMVHQIQVQEAIGLTFARVLRSVLRQDPDVIMVGEIRDEETARIAIQAALTGHLVLATLHTNDAAAAIARLRDMNIEPYLISGVLNGVVAQRLARTICPNCATQYYPTEDVLEEACLTHMSGRAFRKGSGCPQCHDTGFKGRLGIYEVMEVSGDLRRMIHQPAATQELREQWRREGGLTLREEGTIAAVEGKTSLEEILRITRGPDEQREDQVDLDSPKKAQEPRSREDETA